MIVADRYEVSFRYRDIDGEVSTRRRSFFDKDEATRYAKHIQFRVNDLYVGGAESFDVEFYAITEMRHDITERIFLPE